MVSLGGYEYKNSLLQACRLLNKMGFKLYATENTSIFLKLNKLPCQHVYKVYEQKSPNVIEIIKGRRVDLVINLSDREDLANSKINKETSDGYLIRRAAVDANTPLFTKATIANLFVNSLYKYDLGNLKVKAWNDYLETIETKGREERL